MLLAQLLETYPQAQTLYEELQAAATLPRNNPQMLGWNGDAIRQFRDSQSDIDHLAGPE